MREPNKNETWLLLAKFKKLKNRFEVQKKKQHFVILAEFTLKLMTFEKSPNSSRGLRIPDLEEIKTCPIEFFWAVLFKLLSFVMC